MQSIGQMSTQASHSMQSLRVEHGLHVAVQAALRLGERQLAVEAELDLDRDVLQRDHRVLAAAPCSAGRCEIGVVVAPLVDAHLLRHERCTSAAGRCATSSPWQKLSIEIAASWPCATAQMMFFGPKAASPPKKTLGMRRLHASPGRRLRHAPLCRTRCRRRARSRGRRSPGRSRPARRRTRSARRARRSAPAAAALVVVFGASTFSKITPVSRPLSCMNCLGHEVVEDRDALVHARPPSPRATPSSPRSRSGRRPCTSSPPRRRAVRQQSIAVLPPPSTIDAPADLLDVAEGDRGQPVDADVDVRGGFLAAGDVEVAPARRAGADEDRVVAFGRAAPSGCRCAVPARNSTPQVEDVADFLVDHRLGQAEARDLRAHHAARLGVAVEDDARHSRAAPGRARRSARPGRRRRSAMRLPFVLFGGSGSRPRMSSL